MGMDIFSLLKTPLVNLGKGPIKKRVRRTVGLLGLPKRRNFIKTQINNINKVPLKILGLPKKGVVKHHIKKVPQTIKSVTRNKLLKKSLKHVTPIGALNKTKKVLNKLTKTKKKI